MVRQNMPKRKRSQPLTFGSACSGLCAELFAAEYLGVEATAIFACDNDKHVTTLSKHLWQHKFYYNDVFEDEFVQNAPCVDFFLGGFPCGPFSLQGLGKGVNDEAQGTVVYRLLMYIAQKQPTTFLLENVKGLLTAHPNVLLEVMTFLRGLKVKGSKKPLYTVVWACLNSRDFGLPQNRERIFVAGLKNSHKIADFSWPISVPCAEVLFVCTLITITG